MKTTTFETKSVRMEHMLTVTVGCPAEDAARIVERVCEISPLRQGPYVGNAFASGPGIELYRPLEGAAAGAESEPRHRPDGRRHVSAETWVDRRMVCNHADVPL